MIYIQSAGGSAWGSAHYLLCAMSAEMDDFFSPQGPTSSGLQDASDTEASAGSARRKTGTSKSTTKEKDMSLEAQLAELNVNIKALTAALLAAGSSPAQAGKQPAQPPVQPAANPPAAPKGTSAALDYEKDVKPLVLRMAKEKGREKVIAVLGEFKTAAGAKVENANQLVATQYNDFIKAANAALSAA